jgi:hypothetical protein
MSRRERTDRASTLVLVGGGAAVVAVVTFVLAVIGVLTLLLPILAAIVAGICFWLFRRTVS